MPITYEHIRGGFTVEVTRNDSGASVEIPDRPLDPIAVVRNALGVAGVVMPTDHEFQSDRLNPTDARALATMLTVAAGIATEMNGGTN